MANYDQQHQLQLLLQQQAAAQQNMWQRAMWSSMSFIGLGGGYGTQTFSGMGQMYGDPYGPANLQLTHLGTPMPVMPQGPQDPEDIAWLKGRIREVLWTG